MGESNKTLSWKDIFNSSKVFPKTFFECSDIAKSVGYDYFEFNGFIYHVGAKSTDFYLCFETDLSK